MDLALLACDVHKRFGSGTGQINVLRGAGMGVAAGETVFLVGPSGSAKSDEPGEYVDLYDLEVLIELEGGRELPVGYRVNVRIEDGEK